MNKSVNPVVAAGVILCAIVVLGFKFWADQQANGVPRPTLMQAHPDGGVVILVGLSLYHVSSANTLEEVIDLRQFEIENMVGDFAFFSNGDLLIRTDTVARSLGKDLNAIARIRETDVATEGHYNQLSRCSPSDRSCVKFSSELPAFDRTFRLSIDWTDDSVYVADTSRHRLLKLDAKGELLAEKDGFKFPNQLRLYDQRLWIADTNHHRVSALSAQQANFAHELTSHTTKIDDSEWRWPSAFTKVGNQWWVNIVFSNMDRGRVLVYDADWQYLKELDLPAGSDVIGLELLDDEVLISDFKEIAVYRYSKEGEQRSDLDVTMLTDLFAASRAEAQHFRLLGYVVLGVGVIAWMAIFAYAVISGGKGPAEERANLPSSDSEALAVTLDSLPREGMSFTVNNQVRLATKWMWPFMAVMAIFAVGLGEGVFMDVSRDDSQITLMLTLLILPFFPLMLMASRLVKLELVMYPDRVVALKHNHQRVEQNYPDIRWTKSAVLVGDQVVPLKNAKGTELFEGFTDNISPLLKESSRLGAMTMLEHRWRSPEGMLKSLTLTMALLFSAMAYFEREAITQFLKSLGLF